MLFKFLHIQTAHIFFSRITSAYNILHPVSTKSVFQEFHKINFVFTVPKYLFIYQLHTFPHVHIINTHTQPLLVLSTSQVIHAFTNLFNN